MSGSRDYFEIEAELKKRVEGDVRFDKFSRLLYSTDASMYQIEPIGVVVPRHKGDVQAVIEVANRLGVSVLPRGGGTSLAGQTVGHSIVLDFSKYMQNVLGGEQRRAVVPRAAGFGARRIECSRTRHGSSIRSRHIDVQPRHHRRHDRQQLRRRPFAHLRQDPRSRVTSLTVLAFRRQ